VSEAPLYLRILGQPVRIDCAESTLRMVFAANFAAMTENHQNIPAVLHYAVRRSIDHPGFVLSHLNRDQSAEDTDDVLFQLEKDIILQLQRKCPAFLFLHAAALDWQGRACLLVGESGSGKSTTTWALQHHNFSYLSDELSPIDLTTLRVYAYPHALCLKQVPPHPYVLPEGVLQLGSTIRVPTSMMHSPVILDSRPLSALFLLKYSPESHIPTVRAIDTAEASIYLYVSTLNALAHPNSGLDAVVRLAEGIPCFAIVASDLSSTCALIRTEMEKTSPLVRMDETAPHKLRRPRSCGRT
jgi:hypothetical protein